MSLDEFVGRIKTVEDRCDAGEDAENFDHDGKSFLLLAEEWLARYKNRGCAGKKKSTFDIRKVPSCNSHDTGISREIAWRQGRRTRRDESRCFERQQ